MLGKGRPFVIEISDPHRSKFSQEQMTSIQSQLNQQTNDIQVRDLQIVSK